MDEPIDSRKQVALTPTLVIGLGGTGVQVVRRTKGLMARYFEDRNLGDIPPVMRFLAFDSVPLTNPPSVTALERDEYCYLGQVPGASVVSNLHLNPEVEEWWDTKRNAPGKIDNGCGQMRDCGRLVFFYHYNEIRAALERQLNEILFQETIFQTEYRGFVLRRNQVRICLVASIAGGTGSGTFLDATYTVHDILQHRAGITASTEGYLVMPEVYLPHLNSVPMQESVQANGYAALCEMEFLNRNPDRAPEFFHHYPGGHTVNVRRRPYDHCYLVGVRDKSGYGFKNAEQAYESIAEALYLEAVYLDQALTENTANVFADSDVAGDVAGTGVGRYYSSFSVSAVQVLQDIARQYASHRLALDATHALLRPDESNGTDVTPPPDEVEMETLLRDVADEVRKSHVLPDLQGRREPESPALLAILQQNEDALHTWLDTTTKPVGESAQRRQAELYEAVRKKAWETAVERGVDAVFPYLRGWLRRLQQISEELTEREGTLDIEAEDASKSYESHRKDLDKLTLGPGWRILLFDGTAKRRHRREQHFDSGVKDVQTTYTKRYDREVARQVHTDIVRSLLGNTVNEQPRSIARLIKQWETLREVFRGVLVDLEHDMDDLSCNIARLQGIESEYIVLRELSLALAELEHVYSSVEPVLGTKDYLLWIPEMVAAVDSDGGTIKPQKLQQVIRERMLAHGLDVCAPVFSGNSADSAVIQAHQAVHNALSYRLGSYVTKTAVQNELFDYNVPYWNYSGVTNLEDIVEHTDLVAIESAHPEGWDPAAMPIKNPIATGDPSLFAVYRATYGLPLFVLNEIPLLREHYLRRRSINRMVQGRPTGLSLHLDKRWNEEPPVDLSADVKGKAIIAGTLD